MDLCRSRIRHQKTHNLSGKISRVVDWFIAMHPGKRAKLAKSDAQAEKIKASGCAKVEYSSFYIKRVFHYNKVRYLGLEKIRTACICWLV
jgi:hypothetical protein